MDCFILELSLSHSSSSYVCRPVHVHHKLKHDLCKLQRIFSQRQDMALAEWNESNMGGPSTVLGNAFRKRFVRDKFQKSCRRSIDWTNFMRTGRYCISDHATPFNFRSYTLSSIWYTCNRLRYRLQPCVGTVSRKIAGGMYASEPIF